MVVLYLHCSSFLSLASDVNLRSGLEHGYLYESLFRPHLCFVLLMLFLTNMAHLPWFNGIWLYKNRMLVLCIPCLFFSTSFSFFSFSFFCCSFFFFNQSVWKLHEYGLFQGKQYEKDPRWIEGGDIGSVGGHGKTSGNCSAEVYNFMPVHRVCLES